MIGTHTTCQSLLNQNNVTDLQQTATGLRCATGHKPLFTVSDKRQNRLNIKWERPEVEVGDNADGLAGELGVLDFLEFF